jgi:Xylose isomerase-like TIM barrel
MRIALCNEVLAGMTLDRQCEYAARLGYDGLEIAPFTLSGQPDKITAVEAARIRATVEASGLVVTGLHWLLVKPDGLSLTDPDAAVRGRTIEVMIRLTGLCAELGGAVLVHGSPRQRQIAPGETPGVGLARLEDGLAQVARRSKCRRRLLHRAAGAEGDGTGEYRCRGGRTGSRHRSPLLANHDRLQRRRSNRSGIDPGADRPLAADRPDCPRPGQRSEPARSGLGRVEIRTDPGRPETASLCRHPRRGAV